MPTYQYACTACGERLEAVQTFTDAPLTECRVCGGQLRKVFSAVGVVFKGSGFYKTDSRSSGAKSGDGASPSAPAADKPASTPAPAAASSSSSTSSTASTPASKTA